MIGIHLPWLVAAYRRTPASAAAACVMLSSMRRAARCSRTRVLSAAEGTRRQGDQCHGSTARLHAHAREGAGREGTDRINAVGRSTDRPIDPEGLGYRCSAAAEAVLLDICCGSEPARPSAVSILVPSRPPAPPIRSAARFRRFRIPDARWSLPGNANAIAWQRRDLGALPRAASRARGGDRARAGGHRRCEGLRVLKTVAAIRCLPAAAHRRADRSESRPLTQLNAEANGIENCTFVCGKAEEMIDNVIIACACMACRSRPAAARASAPPWLRYAGGLSVCCRNCAGTRLTPATSCLCHLCSGMVRPCHICTWALFTASASSPPGVGSPLPHLAPATSAQAQGSPLSRLHRDCARRCVPDAPLRLSA